MVKFVQYLRNVIPFLQLPRQMRRLTFYSEGKNYWGYLEPLLTELLALSDVPVCYISSDADDPGLLLVHPNYRKFVIDEGHVRDWLFSNIETDVFVMTMPDLHQYQVKRSRHAVHYVYVQHVPNILETAANGGFQVEVATPSILIKAQESYSQFFFIHRPYDSKTNLQVVIDYQTGFVFDLTFFRSVPKILKELVYNGGRWRLSRLYTPNLGLSFNHHASVHFLADVTHRFMLSEQPRVYKLFHLVTPHAPFVTNSNCGYSEKELDREYMNIYNQTRCALIHLVKLLDKFKSSGIYDSATILVHGDHGIRLPFRDLETDPDDDAREFPHPIGNSNPLLLINPPPGGRGNLVTVGAEISLRGIPKTMSKLLQLDDDFDGVDFLNEKPTNRSRRYYHSQQSRVVAGRDDRFLQWNEYEVSGPLTKKSSWSKVGENNWTKKNFAEFPVAEFLEIEQVDLIGKKEVRVRYRDRERHHFIAVGPQKRMTRFVGTDAITAKLRSRNDIEHVCIIDTVRELRQCLH